MSDLRFLIDLIREHDLAAGEDRPPSDYRSALALGILAAGFSRAAAPGRLRIKYDGGRGAMLDEDDQVVGYFPEGLRAVAPEEWEYEVSYTNRSAPSIDGYRVRGSASPMTLSHAEKFASEVENPKIRRRTKGVPAGPWEPVGGSDE